MSALGHKRTSEHIRVMSALPRKRTFVRAIGMSALCQKQTFRTAEERRYSITSSAKALANSSQRYNSDTRRCS
jgi:hypothetical protein